MRYYLPFSFSSDWDAGPLNGFAYIQADSPLLSQIHLEMSSLMHPEAYLLGDDKPIQIDNPDYSLQK